MAIFSIPCLSDNYVHVVHDDSVTAVVDSSESAPVVDFLTAKGWKLDFILLTHHHWDHVGGVPDLKARYGCHVVGFAGDAHRLPAVDIPVKSGELFSIGKNRVLGTHIPGHTLGHIAYYWESEKALFSGDTLFALGCGRLFEGTPAQMFSSLHTLSEFPDDTQIYCGHEYTLGHCQFAEHCFPQDIELRQYCNRQRTRFRQTSCTVPSLLGDEKKFNPFLRMNSVEKFAKLRREKDNWSPHAVSKT